MQVDGAKSFGDKSSKKISAKTSNNYLAKTFISTKEEPMLRSKMPSTNLKRDLKKGEAWASMPD